MKIQETVVNNQEGVTRLINSFEDFVTRLEKESSPNISPEMLNNPKMMGSLFRFAVEEERDILIIPKEAKIIGNYFYVPKVMSISLKPVVLNFSESLQKSGYVRIKINEFNNDALETIGVKNPPNYLVTMIKKEQRLYCFVRGNVAESIQEIINNAELLGLIEYQVNKEFINRERIASSNYWNSDWDKAETVGLYYDTINDPMIFEAFVDSGLPLANKLATNESFVVLDIGAGKGRLAAKLIPYIKEEGIALHYIFVEPDPLQVAIAKENLSSLIGEGCQITFIQSTIEDLSLSHKAHCIISSGGPLNAMVVSLEEAKANIKKCQELLLSDGVIIAAGHTPVQVKGKHFEQQGLEMVSYAKSSFIPKKYSSNSYLQESKAKCSFFGYYQCYVAQKPAELQNDNNLLSNNLTSMVQGLVL